MGRGSDQAVLAVAVTPSEGEGFALGVSSIRLDISCAGGSRTRSGILSGQGCRAASAEVAAGCIDMVRPSAVSGWRRLARDGYTAFPDTLRKWCCSIPCLGVISLFCWSWQPNDVRATCALLGMPSGIKRRKTSEMRKILTSVLSVAGLLAVDVGNCQRPGHRTNRRGCDDHDGQYSRDVLGRVGRRRVAATRPCGMKPPATPPTVRPVRSRGPSLSPQALLPTAVVGGRRREGDLEGEHS